MFKKLAIISILMVLASCQSAFYRDNKLPVDAANALRGAKHITLYSLESRSPKDSKMDKNYYGYKLLGKVDLDGELAQKAAYAFADAVKDWDGAIAACFEPHHAMTLVANDHTYDFVLCYSCHQIYVYEDGKHIAGLGAAGSPEILNSILTSSNVPLSYIYSPVYIAAEKKRIEDNEEARAITFKKWMAAIPESLKPFWEKGNLENFVNAWPPREDDKWPPRGDERRNKIKEHRQSVLNPLHTALAKQFPNQNERILILLNLYGSVTPIHGTYWVNISFVEGMLLDYQTADVVQVLQNNNLTHQQMLGALRLMGEAWYYHPEEINLVPLELKKKVLKEGESDFDASDITRFKKSLGIH